MALVVVLKEGDDVYIGEHYVTVEEIKAPKTFRISVEGPTMIKKLDVSEKASADVAPGIKISAGNNGSIHAIRMVIEAPRSIPIERGKVRRRKESEKREA